jgi:signal transduction histidine kinase
MRDLAPDDIQKLATLANISTILNASYDTDELLSQVLDIVIHTLRAERGCVILARGEHDFEVRVARGLQPQERFDYSHTIVEDVMRSGEPVLSHDALDDERFVSSLSLQRMHTRSIMCVPMRTREKNLGVLYLDNQSIASLFMPTDLDLLAIIAGMAVAAIERAQYFTHLLQQEKLAAIGTMMAGVAHELSSPLTSIMGFATLTLSAPHDAAMVRENVEIVMSEAERCRTLITELLQFSRRGDRRPQELDLPRLCNRVKRLTQAEFMRDHVALDIDLAPDVGPLMGEPDRLTQVLLNLLNNARLVLRGRPAARVTLRARHTAEGLVLEVSDNGPGIEPHVLPRLFDPFFTTRASGDGTGLGLSIVQSIVHDHGGLVRAENLVEGGARFSVTLPAAPALAIPA